jgi:hypothetical protein
LARSAALLAVYVTAGGLQHVSGDITRKGDVPVGGLPGMWLISSASRDPRVSGRGLEQELEAWDTLLPV